MTVGAIIVDGVSKRFRLERNRPSSLKEAVLRVGRTRDADEFWVLKNVDLDIAPGSFFGLIGHNGSGKSTLLRLMAGIHRPTVGSVEATGRLSALLELGTGFHPDLTGRENVYLNGAMLGISRKQMTASMDDIIEFSGIGDFVDEPVKIYSSGMYVRLGFAVAVNVSPDILLVDEVIAVGDEEFQRRCLKHMDMLRDRGTTIVLVSHNTDLMDECHQVGWLDHGKLVKVGTPGDVVSAYLQMVDSSENTLRAHDI
ncbi:MAG: ABC transporter ATP-binding protein [Acidimicrobiaceae bacterium]|nr:ABC transporter ATP-binding protein [Acidimicrobiaceae bacterium]MDE0606886.1 ABC transporter ATP-binding protein [Acidimicrobiaceae bacterium]